MMTSLCKDARRRDICLAQSSDCVPWASGLLWTALDTKLVEAGGIEPPSERCQSKASTCLFSDLDLA